MILLAVVLLAFLIALATGGRLSRLADLPWRALWLPVAGFGAQLIIIYGPATIAPAFFSLHTGLLLLSYGLLLAFVWLNRRIVGMPIIGLGLAMNLTVMLANGGYMPITREALIQAGKEYRLKEFDAGARPLSSKDVLLPKEETKLWILSDIFVAPPPFPIPSIFSPGDVMLAIGALVMIVAGTRRRLSRAETLAPDE